MSERQVPEDKEELLEYAVKNKDVSVLVKAFFDVELYPTQEEIVRTVAFQESRKVVLNCYTRYGKTFSVGIGLALYLLLDGGNQDDLRIGIVGPTDGDCQQLRREMLKAGIKSSEFKQMLDTSKSKSPEDMLKKRNKDTLTFNNGDIEIHNVSASSGRSGDGSGAMGQGFDIVVMDESNRISHSFWKESGDRLLEHEDSILIEMGNPFHKDNQFYQHWTRSDFTRFHVGEEKGLEEGRHTKQWFDERAKERGGRQSLEYTVLFKSEFPDQIDDALIAHSWLERAQKNKFDFENPDIIYAADIAGEGTDKIVLTRLEEEKGRFRLTNQWSKNKSSDTADTAYWIDKKITEDPENIRDVIVDSVGIGAGVHSKLDEIGYPAVKFKAGEKPLDEQDRFQNKKARNFFKIRDVLQENDLELVEGFGDSSNSLIHELTHITTERRSRDRIRIVDPDSGSPDFADSLMMCFYKPKKAKATQVSNPFSI